jgi:hypothetical protein
LKKIALIFLVAFTSASYGYQSNTDSIFVFSDLLIWRVREGNATNWAETISSGPYQRVKVLNASFDWNAGFRVGIGYNSANSWDTTFSYTRYQTNAKNHGTGNIYSGYLGNFYADNPYGVNFEPFYQTANIDWDFWFNNFDLELGRTFKIDSILTLRPFVGLKAAFIDQKIKTNWYLPMLPTTPPSAATFLTSQENLENNFWGIGPSVGLDTLWPFYENQQHLFSLFGDFSGALLYGHWNFKDHFKDNTPGFITITNEDINGGATVATALIGIEWASYISQANLMIRLGYEAQVWFNQLQFYTLNGGRHNDALSLQGGVLDFCVNF